MPWINCSRAPDSLAKSPESVRLLCRLMREPSAPTRENPWQQRKSLLPRKSRPFLQRCSSRRPVRRGIRTTCPHPMMLTRRKRSEKRSSSLVFAKAWSDLSIKSVWPIERRTLSALSMFRNSPIRTWLSLSSVCLVCSCSAITERADSFPFAAWGRNSTS